MTIKSILTAILAFSPFTLKAEDWSQDRKKDEAIQQYNYMQGIVTGYVANTVSVVSEDAANAVKTQAANKEDGSVELGEKLAIAVPLTSGTVATGVAINLSKRVGWLEQTQKYQAEAIQATEDAIKSIELANKQQEYAIKATEIANAQTQRNLKALEGYTKGVDTNLNTIAEKVFPQ